jgi:EpsI family protein
VLFVADGVLAWLRGVAGVPRGPAGGSPIPLPTASRLRLAVGVAAVAAVLSVSLPAPEPLVPERTVLAEIVPSEIDGWTSSRLSVDQSFLGSVWMRQLLFRRYERAQDEVDLFVGLGDRSERRRSHISPKTMLPGSGWIIDERGRRQLEEGQWVDWLLIRSGTRRTLVFHWYENTGSLGHELLRSLSGLDTSPWRRPRDAAIVRASTPLSGAPDLALPEAEARLERFLAGIRKELVNLRS